MYWLGRLLGACQRETYVAPCTALQATARRLATASALPSTGPWQSLPKHVHVYEVGPRDGLQNEKQPIPTDVKIEFINKLSSSGLKSIEATSFVSPKWVPQLADAASVMAGITRAPGVTYAVLTPNMKGLEGALKANAQEVAIFAAASEAFSRKNINCSIADSLKRFEDVATVAKKENVKLRGYVSCVVHCPYSGKVDPKAAADVAVALKEMGCYQVSMGDTTGAGTPAQVGRMFEEILKHIPGHELGAHMHDTYGQALANILVALQLGVATVDSSVAGLGGCPYSPGASGNVATEDVVYMLNGLGVDHGVDVDKLLAAGELICRAMGRANSSRAANAMMATRQATITAAAAAVKN